MVWFIFRAECSKIGPHGLWHTKPLYAQYGSATSLTAGTKLCAFFGS